MTLVTLHMAAVTTPSGTAERPNYRLRLGAVEKLTLPGRKPLEFSAKLSRETNFAGGPFITRAELPEHKARRIARFANLCYVQKATTPYDSFSFLGYVAGWTNDPQVRVSIQDHGTPTSKNELQPGKLYALVKDGRFQHGMIGWGPEHNLSLLGPTLALAITRNDRCMQAFRSAHIVEFFG
jgi:hypothetical protein